MVGAGEVWGEFRVGNWWERRGTLTRFGRARTPFTSTPPSLAVPQSPAAAAHVGGPQEGRGAIELGPGGAGSKGARWDGADERGAHGGHADERWRAELDYFGQLGGCLEGWLMNGWMQWGKRMGTRAVRGCLDACRYGYPETICASLPEKAKISLKTRTYRLRTAASGVAKVLLPLPADLPASAVRVCRANLLSFHDSRCPP